MKSKVTHAGAVPEGSTSPLTSPKLPRVLVFARTVLIQNPAQAINCIFPVAVITRSQVRYLANRARVGPAASEHLPQAVASV